MKQTMVLNRLAPAPWTDGWFRNAARLLLYTLREIFDENAYQRFLDRRGIPSSGPAFREFQEETRKGQERRVKCC